MIAFLVRRPGWACTAAAAAGAALMICAAFAQGQDYNWDLLNYHFLTPELLVQGRLGDHIAPSGLQSWFNPLVYFPAWWLISYTPPWVASAVFAIIAGLNAGLLYALGLRLAPGLAPGQRAVAAALCAFLGLTGAITISLAGTSFADVWMCLPILGALLLLLDAEGVWNKAALAGVLVGAACGLKLTMITMAVGLAAAVVAMAILRRMSWATVFAFALGGVIGAVLGSGWWAWRMWIEVGNPVFPLFNNLFQSPLAPAQPLNDTNFLPQSPLDFFRFPWLWAQGLATSNGGELPIRDPRYLVGLVASLTIVATWLRRDRTQGNAELLLAFFFLFGLAAWLFVFAILRYAEPLEMIAGLLMLAAIGSISRLPARRVMLIFLVAVIAVAGGTRYNSWSRVAFSDDWFGVTGVEAVHQPGTVYILPDYSPLGFLVASFPADAHFVHIDGNFPLEPGTGLGIRAQALIASATNLRSLSAKPNSAAGVAALARFGLRADPESCLIIATKAEPVESCTLVPRR